MKSHLSAFLLALGLLGLGLGLGLSLKSAVGNVANSSRTITVRGLSEREVEANKVTWPVVYKVIGNDVQELYRQIEQHNKVVIEYLTTNGLEASDINLVAPKVVDRQADRYNHEHIDMRYVSTCGVIVTTNKVALVNKLKQNQGELMKKGVAIAITDYDYYTEYEYTSLNDIKPEMIAEATSNARAAAQKFADDSGSNVGKLMSATQGSFSIEDRDSYTPYIKKLRVVTTMTYLIED